MRCGRFQKPSSATIIFSAKFRIFYILGSTHETYRSPLSKRKTTHSGVGGKKHSNDLAVTPAHISWCLSPGIRYGTVGFRKKMAVVATSKKKTYVPKC